MTVLTDIEAMLAVEMFVRGMDTAEIASVMRRSEAQVYNAVARRRS